MSEEEGPRDPTEAADPIPGSPFLGGLIICAGALLALLSGLCAISDSNFVALGAGSAAVGLFLVWLGWGFARKGRPPKRPPPPLPPRDPGSRGR